MVMVSMPKGQSEENSVDSSQMRKRSEREGRCRVVKTDQTAVRSRSTKASTLMLMECIWVDPEEHRGSEGTPTCRRSLLYCCGELFFVRDTSDSREENTGKIEILNDQAP